MAKIFFCNKGAIDLNAIAIMGVSVKVTDNPIGYFGTGLKFSIATLLRTGHKVTLTRLGERIPFTAEPETIRGQEFHRVRMGDELLGFTTALGKNWEPWQAYRELRCNCTDEGGVIDDKLPPGEWDTIFEVEGDAIARCHDNRREIFLEAPALGGNAECTIHPGRTDKAFYRGVRAHEHSQFALFTYNVIDKLELTEDRTIKFGWMVPGYYAPRAIVSCDDESLIEQALMAEKGYLECGFNYENCGKPTLAFMDVAFRNRRNVHCNRSAIKLWEKHSDVRLTYSEASLDAYEESQIEKGMDLVRRLGADIQRADFMVVDGLGESIYGCVRSGRILIAKAALDLGHRFIASTLYEEWLHKNDGLKDESRALQNVLFEKLFAMVERLCAIEAMTVTQTAERIREAVS